LDIQEKQIFRNIKQVEPIVFAFLILSLILKYFDLPFSSIPLIISSVVLAIMAFVKMQSVKLKTNKSGDEMEIFFHRFMLISLVIGYAGLLFHIQEWPRNIAFTSVYILSVTSAIGWSIYNRKIPLYFLHFFDKIQTLFLFITCLILKIYQYIY
jgi:hypothetical protein